VIKDSIPRRCAYTGRRYFKEEEEEEERTQK